MPRQIELSQGKFATVDDADYEFLRQWKWFARKAPDGKWYAVRGKRTLLGARHVQMSRALLGVSGKVVVDHINGDTLDNRRCNLRECSTAQNAINRGTPHNNKSGYKGVSWYARFNQWRAVIRVNYRLVHLGYFDSPEDAARAYDMAAKEHFGEFAVLNFPKT